MLSVRIWDLGSTYDAAAGISLANKLTTPLPLENLSIRTSVRGALRALVKHNENGESLSERLRKATQHYLKQDDYVIFFIDSDGPMATHQCQPEQDSLIYQIQQVVNDHQFDGKVSLAQTELELEELLRCKSLEPPPTTGWEEWERVASPFWKAFADTPEDEVLRDFEEALAEVRRERL